MKRTSFNFSSPFKLFPSALDHFRWPLILAAATVAVLTVVLFPGSGQAAPSAHTEDDSAPYVSSILRWSPGVERTNSDTLRWAVVFTEGVANVDSSDFDVDGTTASLTVTSINTHLDSVHFVTLSGGDLANLNGSVRIAISANNDITDSHGNSLGSTTPAWNRNTYTVVNVIPPRLLSIVRKSPGSTLTNVDSLTWRVSFDNPVEVDVSDFSVSGAPGVTSLATLAQGMVYDVMFAEGEDPSQKGLADLNGPVSLSMVEDHGIVDADGVEIANSVPDGANETVFVLDNVAPVLSEVAAVTTPGSDLAPMYSFSTTEAGEITYGGSCASNSTLARLAGTVQVQFNTLAVGDHANCTITVTDAAGNASETLAVSPFTLDVTVPRISSVERSWPETETTAADALIWLVTFTKPVINVDPDDFEVDGSVANVIGVVPIGLGMPGTPTTSYFVAVQGGDLDLLNGVVSIALKDGRNIADLAGNPLTDETPTGTNDDSYVLENLGPDPAPPSASNMVIHNVRYNSIDLGAGTSIRATFSPTGLLLATFDPHRTAGLTCAEGEIEHGWYSKSALLTRSGADGLFTHTADGLVYQAITIPSEPGEYVLRAYCVNGTQRSDALSLWGGSISLTTDE